MDSSFYMITCINFCELLYPDLFKMYSLKQLIDEADLDSSPERLYIGSSFCSQYFLHLSRTYTEDFINKTNLPVTLTLPIFSQKDLKLAKNRILKILTANQNIDEITVNDVGMYDFIKDNTKCKINLGRLFFKDPRDVRIPEYNKKNRFIDLRNTLDLYENISGVELDLISQSIDFEPIPGLTVSLHTPYTFQTTGNICKFASIPKNVDQKFRANTRCRLECEHIHEYFPASFKGKNEELFRLGRTVYFYQNPRNIKTNLIDRNIVFPLKEIALIGDRN